MSAPAFAAAFAQGDPRTLAADCLAQLPAGQQANLGILYISEPTAPALAELVRELSAGTGITAWVGGVGLGIFAPGHEAYELPAAAVITASLPQEGFRLFGATDDPAADLPRQHAKWIEATSPALGLVHGDPRCENLLRATVDAAAASGLVACIHATGAGPRSGTLWRNDVVVASEQVFPKTDRADIVLADGRRVGARDRRTSAHQNPGCAQRVQRCGSGGRVPLLRAWGRSVDH